LSSTATPTPSTTAQTLTFDDLSSPNRALNNQYPSGIADWGLNIWYLSGPYGQFTTQSVSFNGATLTSGILSLSTPRRLVQLEAFNGGSGSTITLACAGQTTRSQVVAANQRMTILTNWTGTCSTVTFTSSNGWWTNFDNILIQ
jgi:hypothetical protein